MPHARTRFFALVGLLLSLFAGGERLARLGRISAARHRVTFKLALLDAKGGAHHVVLGSSRGNDCVAPSAFGPGGVSLAVPSTTLETLEQIVEHAAQAPGLKLALVELSRRQAADGPAETEPPLPLVDADEDPAAGLLSRHSALLRSRGAFAPENWTRLAGLIAPRAFDGSEYFRSRWAVEAFKRVPAASPEALDAVRPSGAAAAAQSGPEWERISTGYRRIADGFAARGVKVVLFATPVLGRVREEECDEASVAFRASVAAHAGAPLFDFTCSAVPESWLTDGEGHCGALGRARFSEKLAGELRALP